MAKPKNIELPTGESIPILYEDRSVLAIDKPRGWMLVPGTWQKTRLNLQLAITSSIQARDFWARSRNLRFLRYVHRLDAETTGILLFAKSPLGVRSYGTLFEGRAVEKTYLVVVEGIPATPRWIRGDSIGPDPEGWGRMIVDPRHGKKAETEFILLETRKGRSLVEARPYTGRTHQIRIHAAASGCPVINDELYGKPPCASGTGSLGLRAVRLLYRDPFTSKPICIQAPVEGFLAEFGFTKAAVPATADHGQTKIQVAPRLRSHSSPHVVP